MCVYTHLNKHRLRGMPNMITCAAVNAFLCHPLCSGLEKLKSLQQSDWLPATFFLPEKRRTDLCRLKQTFQIGQSHWKFGCSGPKGSFEGFICEAVCLRPRIEVGVANLNQTFWEDKPHGDEIIRSFLQQSCFYQNQMSIYRL